MMGKLQQDTILWNAKKYKIDGFRFDIMSFTFVSNLQRIKQALAKLTLANDGIDGSKIYIYGEGFNFGETANSALGVNASQLNLYGYGIGTFNDRIRDGVRGGGPFDDERVQGFATGLFTDPSMYTQQNTSSADQKSTLLHRSGLDPCWPHWQPARLHFHGHDRHHPHRCAAGLPGAADGLHGHAD